MNLFELLRLFNLRLLNCNTYAKITMCDFVAE